MRTYYIIGSGVVGSVLARELAEKGKKVVLWERRNHLGGNVYDYIDNYGIRVHMYGPHIFHTKREHVWKYVTQFCKFDDYNLTCGAVIDGKCVPTAFDFQTIDMFFGEEADIIKNHIKSEFGNEKSATVLQMLESKDVYVRKFAQFLYDKDYAPYTAKQWGIEPEKVDRQIFSRVPVLFSYGSKYFDDTYQGIPHNGYEDLINQLLNHHNIKVETNIEALDHICIENNRIIVDGKDGNNAIIYTGPLDELFDCVYGKLPYRSLRFEWVHEEIESFQDMPVVAYPQVEKYTRITEYKKLPYQNVNGTTYAIEYPLPYEKDRKEEPYYPVITEASKELYGRYEQCADKIENLYYCGRLADFKYYNMDDAIDRALNMSKQIV